MVPFDSRAPRTLTPSRYRHFLGRLYGYGCVVEWTLLTENAVSLPQSRRLPHEDARRDKSVKDLLSASAPRTCACFMQGNQIAINMDRPEPVLPYRVLDLRTSAGSSKLALREGMAACRGRYVAVSHRWGGDIPFKTTQQNRSQYLDGMDAARLPQNFRDVLELAEVLDIRYVWIDALCVLYKTKERSGLLKPERWVPSMQTLRSPLHSTNPEALQKDFCGGCESRTG